MKEVLVNNWNLPDNSPLGSVPVMKEAGSQKTYPHSIKQTLTSRFEHRVMRPRSFHMEKGRLISLIALIHINSLTKDVSSFSAFMLDDQDETSNQHNPVDNEDMPHGTRTPPTPPSRSPGIELNIWERAKVGIHFN